MKPCRCPAGAPERYRQRLSGPLRDRFDLTVELPAVKYADWQAHEPGEATSVVRARVVGTRERQAQRQGCTNARLDTASARRHCALDDPAARTLLAAAVDRFAWSARSVTRVLRVARTIADLAGADRIATAHLAEAIQFRDIEGGN